MQLTLVTQNRNNLLGVLKGEKRTPYVETSSFAVRLYHSVGDYAICQVSVNFDIDGIHRKLSSKGEYYEKTVQ